VLYLCVGVEYSGPRSGNNIVLQLFNNVVIQSQGELLRVPDKRHHLPLGMFWRLLLWTNGSRPCHPLPATTTKPRFLSMILEITTLLADIGHRHKHYYCSHLPLSFPPFCSFADQWCHECQSRYQSSLHNHKQGSIALRGASSGQPRYDSRNGR
jgi:hypothetical protein